MSQLAARVLDGLGPAFRRLADDGSEGSPLTEDSTDPGFFTAAPVVPDPDDDTLFLLSGSGLIQDPDQPGLYYLPVGGLLAGLVGALVRGAERADDLLQPTEQGWAAAFDLATTPDPAWLGGLTGTRVPRGLAADDQRTFITGRSSWQRGTPAALTAAIRATLTGSQRVELSERDTSPWHLTVRVYEAETPDPAATRAALDSQKPVGIVADLIIAAGATYAHMSAEHGPTYADSALDFPTYYDAYVHIPEEA